MSVRTHRNIFCDIDDERPCAGWLDTDDAPVREMRAVGKRRGWKCVFRDGRWIDICPEHSRAGA